MATLSCSVLAKTAPSRAQCVFFRFFFSPAGCIHKARVSEKKRGLRVSLMLADLVFAGGDSARNLIPYVSCTFEKHASTLVFIIVVQEKTQGIVMGTHAATIAKRHLQVF